MVGQRRGGVVHAVGLPYRERSHFDAQQVLESGGTRPYELVDRLARPRAGRQRQQGPRPQHHRAAGAARPGRRRHLGAVGAARSVGRPRRPAASACTPAIRRWRRRSSGRASFAPTRSTAMQDAGAGDDGRERAARRGAFVALSRRAAEFLAQPNGPQAAVLEIGGWDTHANQANPNGAARRRPAPARPRPGGAARRPRRRRRLGAHRRRSSSASSAARSRSTARSAPTTAPAASPSCSAARSRAAASSPTGRAWRKASATRAATCASPPTCARC